MHKEEFMNKDLKKLLQLIIKAGVEQGILGQSSRVCRKQRTKSSKKKESNAQSVEGKEE